MKVIVLGAGLLGVTAAHYLANDGHEVTVLDRQAAAGQETSFANGGQLSASHSYPWAAPDAPGKMLKWLGRKDAPLLYRPRLDPSFWLWSLRFLFNCRRSRFIANTERNVRMALYSRRLLRELRAGTGLAYDEKTLGILQIFRTRRELDFAAATAERLAALGCENRRIDAEECVALEPALETRAEELIGGIHTPADESGDALLFTLRLADLCAERGVAFRFGEAVSALEAEGDRIAGVRTDRGRYTADAYVLALGSFTPLFVRPLGLRLPVEPAKGYSITVPVGVGHCAPEVSIIDEDHKVVYSRLGDRLRAAGTAEFAGYNAEVDPARARMVLDVARRQFPHGGAYEDTEFWAGLRPLTPDCVPVVSGTRFGNLFLNTGHGTLGWTMCCGSGRLLADLVSGRTPELDPADYALGRFG